MKLIQTINQNIPIWSVIKGDHACADFGLYANNTLLTKPNFLDKRENAIRSEYLKNTKGRKWLHEYLSNSSFGLFQLEKEDLKNVLSVWKDVPLYEVAKEYKTAYQEKEGFEYKGIKKPWEAVKNIYERRKQLVELNEPTQCLTDYDVDVDYHRSIWMKRSKDNQWQIIDGTHRALTLTITYLLSNKEMPSLYCFGFHE